MYRKLIDLITANRKKLLELKISMDEIKSLELDFKEEAEQVDLFSEKAFMRITWFKFNRLYMQILNIESEETIYFFDGVLDNETNIGEFIMNGIYKMNY